MDFEQAVEDWKAHDQWEFADKQAAWGFFFMAGRESKQRENEMDPHIDGVVPVQMTDAERGFLNGMLIGNLRRIYAAHDDEGNDLSALPSRAADEIERLQGLPETIEAMDKAMNDWTDKAARGECGWICSDCCCSFPEGMPDECAHGHQKCTDIIQRDKPQHWCHDCTHYVVWSDKVPAPRKDCPDDYNPCTKGHEMRFMVPEEYDDEYGFYLPVCADRDLTPNALGQEPCADVCARSPAPEGYTSGTTEKE